ncbi:LysE family translocator [Roseateles sp. BYS180W]|uniref:LysE family translocator n=1 Tax=Roseateles rivi TaxID=3299028 RepID=A0ABW7FRU2_9BURK
MTSYLLFLAVAALTVLSPGPGVLMTIANALRFGFRGTVGGIFGIAAGAFIVAGISATALGALLAASAVAFSVMKFVGAAYLMYLGLKIWKASPPNFCNRSVHEAKFLRRFGEGLALQMTNPKAIFFFLSVFPQFVESGPSHKAQFALLVASYATLVVCIHTGYALFAHQARAWLTSERGGRLLNKAGGATFMGFGAALALAKRSGT